MIAILALGFTIGLAHAMEADHLAAVATIASRHSRPADIVKHGLTWGLGQVLWKLWKSRIHAHVHDHDGAPHVHLHSHQHEPGHAHRHGFRWRTLAVGLMHGLAGSAALLLLAMTQVRAPVRGLAYIFVFGVGSMAGMAALSAAISVPLALSARFIAAANNGLQALIGLGTACLGAVTVLRHW
ncbi:MAG TPA: hypothetical protein VH083_25755 [Myxococcales bacterium]|nr:hypothetical protein [Myxococcales bacterium]